MKALALEIAVALASCSGAVAARAPLVPTPIGAGAQFHPAALNPSVARGATIGSLRCTSRPVARTGVHLELLANGRVVIVPSGIGIAPPLKSRGAMVSSGRCSYAVRTREPTGVIEVARTADTTLGDFFAVWGKPLGRERLVGFRTSAAAPVRAYVGGRPWRSDIRSIPLRPHAQIVLELGRHIPPHTSYHFPEGL